MSSSANYGRARGLVESYSAWQVEVPTAMDILKASELQERYQLSFRDAMIVYSAISSGAELLLSENPSSGQLIDGFRSENPFLRS